MNNPCIECRVEFTNKGKLIKENTDPLIIKYCELNSKHHFALENALRVDKTFSSDELKKSQYMQQLKYKNAAEEIKNELSQYGYSDCEIADILVKFLYGVKQSKHKSALWLCYGDYIVENLERIFKPQTKAIQCVDCGEWFDVPVSNKRTKRCYVCQEEHRKLVVKEKNKRYYSKNNN